MIIVFIIIISPVLRFIIFEFLPLNSESQKLSFINIQLISQLDAFAFGALAANISKNISISKSFYIRFWVYLLSVYLVYVTYYFFNKNINNNYIQLTSFGFEWLLRDFYGYIWGYSILNLTFGLIVLGIVKFPGDFKILGNSILVNLGKFSYSIYLFHVPILEFTYYLKRIGLIQNRPQMGFFYFNFFNCISIMAFNRKTIFENEAHNKV